MSIIFGRYAMDPGQSSLYLVYDYMDEGDLAHNLDRVPPLTEWERIKVSSNVSSRPHDSDSPSLTYDTVTGPHDFKFVESVSKQ